MSSVKAAVPGRTFEELARLQEKLDALFQCRRQKGNPVNPTTWAPETAEEKSVWNELTRPENLSTIQQMLRNIPFHSASKVLWERIIAECQRRQLDPEFARSAV